MSKGKYSAVDCNGWFGHENYRRFDADELVVGIDCAKMAFYAAMMGDDFNDFDVVYFERDDIPSFVGKLADLPFETVTLVVEPTGTYADALMDQARQAGLGVVRINGDRVNKSADVFDGVPSMHDGKAAYLLARLYLHEVGEVWEQNTDEQRDLRALAQMDQLVEKSQQMLRGPLEALLARHWPELGSMLSLTSATLLELVTTYGSAAEVARCPDEAEALMRQVGGPLLSDDKIEAILASARETIGVDPTPLETTYLQFVAGTLRQAARGGKDVQRQIEQAAVEDEQTRQMVGFTGKRTAVTFVALLGALTDYDSAGQLEKAFGLNLCEHTTGQTRQDKARQDNTLHISKRGPSRARAKLYFLALRLINPQCNVWCPVATAWYRQRLERNGGNTLKALVALMRKAVSALWWVARGADYQADKLFDVPRLKRLGYLARTHA